MYDLSRKTVFITGASAGIGRACAESAARAGARLVITARRLEKLSELEQDLKDRYACDVLSVQLDVRDAAAVDEVIQALPVPYSAVDILVNNAGLALEMVPAYKNSVTDIDTMIDTNVKGLLYVTRSIVAGMVERDSGHIINIGSMAGHDVYAGGTVYCATKFAVNAITRGLKIDLHGTNIRVSTVDPGMVETDFSKVRFKGDTDWASSVYAGTTPLVAEDIADAVMFCATRPEHVNIGTIIMSTVDQSSLSLISRSEN